MSERRHNADQALVLPPLLNFIERDWGRDTALDRVVRDVVGTLRRAAGRNFAPRGEALVAAAGREEARLRALTDGELGTEARRLKEALVLGRRGRDRGAPAALGRDLAVLREVARRTLGLRAHDVQLIGAALVIAGNVAEMATGEGKTLVAGLAAGWRALAGTPVHIVTVNDYLAARDAETLAPFYEFLGLRVGVVTGATERPDRARQYRCQVCYCTNKELAFDYLRQSVQERNRPGSLQRRIGAFVRSPHGARQVIPGLQFAIIDEIDSVLVDEARTPLILSEGGEEYLSQDTVQAMMTYAGGLDAARDFQLDPARWSVKLFEKTKEHLHATFGTEPRGPLSNRLLREELLVQALLALHIYRPQEHYLVRNGKVGIVDEYTGRVMPDRSWRSGLHQMIEFKEGCELSKPEITKASMTYQRFFRRYVTLSGMSGTAREVARELWNVYEVDVVAVPTCRPCRRQVLGDRMFRDEAEKWRAITAHVADLHASGAPVLIGCRTVAGSELASRHLGGAGLAHQVLNADEIEQEAAIIARAGQRGQITVATNMAGRGTDIALGEGVVELGGLHVIMSERHDARRIDRQLEGRCARQGEPGSFVAMLSLQDRLLGHVRPAFLARACQVVPRLVPSTPGKLLIRWAQYRLEHQHSRIRERLLKGDQGQNDLLAFSGTPE